jgi:hypothetical protein
VIALPYLSRYFDNKKSLKDRINEDLYKYINYFQKELKQDPDRSWIATQRALGFALLVFQMASLSQFNTPRKKQIITKKQVSVSTKNIQTTNKGHKDSSQAARYLG